MAKQAKEEIVARRHDQRLGKCAQEGCVAIAQCACCVRCVVHHELMGPACGYRVPPHSSKQPIVVKRLTLEQLGLFPDDPDVVAAHPEDYEDANSTI